jgi:hypothetical protein
VTLADIAKFAGQVPPRIRPSLQRLLPTLREFRDEAGRTLFDLPRAPRPPAETAAPVRFLPRYEQVLIAYQYRDRIIAARHRPAIYSKNGIIEATFLIDGIVGGTWDVATTRTEAVVRLHPFAKLTQADRRAGLAEAEALARFVAPGATVHGARVA